MLVVGDWDGEHPTVPADEPRGPMWREGVDDEAVAVAIAVIVAQSHDQAAEPTDATTQNYLSAFNAWLETLRAGA